ncbi:MAG TPA: hypothetical protein VEX69_02365 [Candidatus Limnocylindria bacterium]|nr:hypothetical protein [Candidatus Limnocylindria bacterium]
MTIPSNLLGQTKPDDQWENLKQITRRRTFLYVDRQLQCGNGKIDQVTERTVTLKREDHTKITIARQDLLRLGEWGLSANGIVYSARSSWTDVRNQLHSPNNPHRRARLRIVALDGKIHEGQLIEVDETHLALLDEGKKVQLAKSDIAKVYYLRLKPWSDRAEYIVQEAPVIWIIDPEVVRYELDTSRIPVLLYDSSALQDESAIECRKN